MIRFLTAAVVVLLAAVAAVVSYRHAYEVVIANGETGFTAWMVPLTIDGLIFASSMVLLDAARRALTVPKLARWTLGLGVLATLAANVAHGVASGPVGAVVAAWPAVALVLSYELLMGLIRRTGAGTAPAELDALPSVPVPAVPAPSPAPTPVLGPVPDELFPVAADRYAEDLAAGRVPSMTKIKKELSVGQPRAARISTYLGQLVQS